MDSEQHGPAAVGSRAGWSRRRLLGVGVLGLGGLWALARFTPRATAVGAPGIGPRVSATAATDPNLILNPSFQDGGVGRVVPSWSLDG